jgi:hypothetical protein
MRHITTTTNRKIEKDIFAKWAIFNLRWPIWLLKCVLIMDASVQLAENDGIWQVTKKW